MLRDLKRLSERDDLVGVDDLRKAASVILERQFLYSDVDRDRKVYFTLVTQGEYFRDLFDALNHEFVHDPEIGMVGILPRGRTTSVRLKKDEALILLILRFIYEDALENFKQQQGCAASNSEKILAKYEVATRGEKRPLLTELRRILTMFKAMGVIDNLEDDNRVLDFRIRPAIRYVLNESWLKTLELHAGGTPVDDDSANEDIETDFVAGSDAEGDELEEEDGDETSL
jgi:hypothetical protein